MSSTTTFGSVRIVPSLLHTPSLLKSLPYGAHGIHGSHASVFRWVPKWWPDICVFVMLLFVTCVFCRPKRKRVAKPTYIPPRDESERGRKKEGFGGEREKSRQDGASGLKRESSEIGFDTAKTMEEEEKGGLGEHSSHLGPSQDTTQCPSSCRT
eukprot:873822-Amorphochlora_amoeboformis.AAC.1